MCNIVLYPCFLEPIFNLSHTLPAAGYAQFQPDLSALPLPDQSVCTRQVFHRSHRHLYDTQHMPFGSDTSVSSNFQLIAGSNRDLFEDSRQGKFREDLLARINLWTYRLPSLKERIEDLEVNLDYELDRFAQKAGSLVSFNKAARMHYLKFAYNIDAIWRANFRDLNASVTRMATLADGGRITEDVVDDEIQRLKHDWSATSQEWNPKAITAKFLDEKTHAKLDLFEHIQLAGIARVCKNAKSMAEAGRILFDQSREQKKSVNDSHRLKQLLGKYGVGLEQFKT